MNFKWNAETQTVKRKAYIFKVNDLYFGAFPFLIYAGTLRITIRFHKVPEKISSELQCYHKIWQLKTISLLKIVKIFSWQRLHESYLCPFHFPLNVIKGPPASSRTTWKVQSFSDRYRITFTYLLISEFTQLNYFATID